MKIIKIELKVCYLEIKKLKMDFNYNLNMLLDNLLEYIFKIKNY
jgi:hypothetical protein